MESFTELAIVLKSFPYQERDQIAVCLTENHGRITGLARNAIHSRRYGGSLQFLTCSKVSFLVKPMSEMAGIQEATTHHEFTGLAKNFELLAAASFAAEICMRLLEPHAPAREVFLALSNFLFFLDDGAPLVASINAFLAKTLNALGYTPTLFRCVQCQKAAHTLLESGTPMFWHSEAGGLACGDCANLPGKGRLELTAEFLLSFNKLGTTTFRQLRENEGLGRELADPALYRVLTDFLHHHLPGVPASGFKSWKLMNETIYGNTSQSDFLSSLR